MTNVRLGTLSQPKATCPGLRRVELKRSDMLELASRVRTVLHVSLDHCGGPQRTHFFMHMASCGRTTRLRDAPQ